MGPYSRVWVCSPLYASLGWSCWPVHEGGCEEHRHSLPLDRRPSARGAFPCDSQWLVSVRRGEYHRTELWNSINVQCCLSSRKHIYVGILLLQTTQIKIPGKSSPNWGAGGWGSSTKWPLITRCGFMRQCTTAYWLPFLCLDFRHCLEPVRLVFRYLICSRMMRLRISSTHYEMRSRDPDCRIHVKTAGSSSLTASEDNSRYVMLHFIQRWQI